MDTTYIGDLIAAGYHPQTSIEWLRHGDPKLRPLPGDVLAEIDRYIRLLTAIRSLLVVGEGETSLR